MTDFVFTYSTFRPGIGKAIVWKRGPKSVRVKQSAGSQWRSMLKVGEFFETFEDAKAALVQDAKWRLEWARAEVERLEKQLKAIDAISDWEE